MDRTRHFLRLVALLPCLALAACLADGNEQKPDASVAAVAPQPASAPAPSPAPAPSSSRRAAGGGSGAGGGATTAAARAPAVDPEDRRDPLTQARVDCWMKVEHEKMKDIDRRIAFVDKCVAATMKGQ